MGGGFFVQFPPIGGKVIVTRGPAPLLLAVRTPEDSRPVRRGGRAARQASGRKPVANLR